MGKLMKKAIFIVFIVCIIAFNVNIANAKTNKININKTFTGFLKFCMKDKCYDENEDGYLSAKEIRKIHYIGYANRDGKIDLKGISKLKYIETLVFDAKYLTNLDEIKELSRLKKLKLNVEKFEKNKVLDLRKNHRIQEINVAGYYGKNQIKIGKNHIKKLNLKNVNGGAEAVGKCSEIEKLRIVGDQTSKYMVIKNNKHIKSISLGSRMEALEKVTVKFCKNLEKLDIYTKSRAKLNNLKSIEVLNNKKMKYIEVGSNCPNVSKFIIRNLPVLRCLSVEKNNFIENLRLENVPKLRTVIWENGKLSNLEIIGENSISTMEISNNNFKKFEYPELKNLSTLNIENNKLQGSFNVDNYPQIYDFVLANNNLTMIYGIEEKDYSWRLHCNGNENLKLVYLPNYYFWYFDCTVPHVKIYVCCNEEWVDKTADKHITWWMKDYSE